LIDPYDFNQIINHTSIQIIFPGGCVYCLHNQNQPAECILNERMDNQCILKIKVQEAVPVTRAVSKPFHLYESKNDVQIVSGFLKQLFNK